MEHSDNQPGTSGSVTKAPEILPPPIANYSAGHLLNLSPELWAIIFTYLKEEELLKCTHTFPIWERFLHDKMDAIRFHVAFPIFARYLNAPDVKSCSEVSQAWNRAVDAAFISVIDDTNPDTNEETRRDARGTVQYMTPDFYNERVPRERLEKILNSTSRINPANYRRVIITFKEGSPQYFDYVQKLTTFFTKFGYLVAEMVFHYSEANKFSGTVSLFRAFLALTPNLRSLKITEKHAREPVTPQGEVDVSEPLPPLQDLHKLQLNAACPRVIKLLLDNYGKHLSCIQFNQQLKPTDGPSFAGLSSLKILSLKITMLECLNYYIAQLRGRTPPITSLTLDVSRSDYGYLRFKVELAALINIFAGTLETLKITADDARSLPSEENVNRMRELYLPKCTTLILNLMGAPSLEYLEESTPALEKLILYRLHRWDEDDVDIDRRLRLYNRMYSGDVFWEKMRRMKSVRVDGEIYLNEGKESDLRYRRRRFNLMFMKNIHKYERNGKSIHKTVDPGYILQSF